MKKNALITGEELARAEAETLRYNQNQSSRLGSWFTDRVLEECEKRFGQDAVYFGGLKIFTTLDPVMQNAAQNASSIGIASLRKNTGLEDMEAALIAISPLSGAIVAHIGGTDYSRSQFDRAFDARRRPGSGFKPFLYYTALTQKNYTPATLALDSPITIKVPGSKDWAPENDNSLYYGQVILKFALAKSLNSVAARLVNAIGAEKVIEVARQFGVQSPLDNAPSIALGTSAVSPLEMASAFSIIAASGQYYQPYLIERIESPTGELLYEHFIASKNVADPGTIFLLLDMMKAVIDMGTARSVRSSGLTLPAAGKTGTTDDFTDSWFTGFTPNLCVSVWVGCDQEKPMKDRNGVGITGARGGLPIWIQFMKSALEGTSPRDFSQPPDINYIALNPFTGMPQEGDSSMVVALPASASLPDSPPELSGKYGFP
jgi:penicillin-binding protein 1A